MPFNFHCTRVPAKKKLRMHQEYYRAMYRFLLLLSTLFLALPLAGGEAPVDRPLDIVVNFAPPFPREFTAYFNNPTAYSITVTNFSDQDQEVYFLAEMRGLTNNVLVQTDRNFRSSASVVIPAQGTVMLTGEDVANLNENISLNDINISGLPGGPSINGILPEGIYQFCINAYDFVLDDVQPLSVGCGTIIDITYADQLTILNPGEGDVILANPSSAFEMMWDPNEADPMRRMDIEYEVKMIDITTYPDEDLDILLRDGGPQVEFEEDMIMNEFYLYNSFGTNFELEFGHQYAMRVRRVDAEPVPLINDGYSEIRTFWYGEIPEPEPDEQEDTPANITDCVANCEFTEEFIETRMADAAGRTTLEIGNFTMEDVVFTGGTTGPTWRGRGTINLGGWMMNYPLAVTFTDIVINTEGRVIAGEVTPRDDSNGSYDLGDIHRRLDGIANYIPESVATAVNQHVTSLRMLDGLLTGEPQGFPVGINEELQGHRFVFVFVGASFKPRSADLDLITVVDMTSLNPSLLLPLAANGVCLTPDGLGSEGLLSLRRDIESPPLGDMTIALTGTRQSDVNLIKQQSCFVEFDCDGLKSMAVRGKVGFPRSVMVPDVNGVAADTGQVQAAFEFTLDRNIPITESAYAYRAPTPGPGQTAPTVPPAGNHMMLGLTMTPFQITGLDGWTFVLRDGTLDLSDLENPAGMKFPKDYSYSTNVDTGALWQGFHLKEITMMTPATMRADSQRTAVSLADILIDPEPSLSMNVRAVNIIDKSIGALDGWGFSLDTFQMTIMQNTLIDGRLLGKLSTPLVGSADYLKYKAIVNRNEQERYEFNAIATPEKDSIIRLPMVLAKAGICPNSFIQFRTVKDTTKLQAFLAGQMAIDIVGNMPDSVQALNLVPELSIKFAEFQLNFDNERGFVTEAETTAGDHSMFGFAVDFQDQLCGTNYNGPVFVDTDRPDYDYDVGDINNILHDGLPDAPEDGDETAPQEKISGFPISIGDTDFAFEGQQVRVDLRVDLHLNGSENHEIKGSATVGMASTLKRDGLKIKKFHIDSVYLSAITVGTEEDPIDLDFMSMYGGVRFVNFSGGKGFQGELYVRTSADFGFDLKAGFGKAGDSELGAYGTENYHGWWYLDGMFRFPSPGIQMGIVGMNGIGGGVYWNCTAPVLTLSVADVMAAADGSAPTPNAAVPQASYGERTIAFRTLMSLVRPSVMMVEPEIVANWTAGQGLNSLSLNGDFWSLSRAGGFAGEDDLYKTTSRLWGNTQNTLLFERGEGRTKVAVMGTNAIYANLIDNVLYGAGEDQLMVRSAFAVGHKDLFAEYDIGNITGNTYWFFNVGNPYEGNMGGLRFNLPGFNLNNAGEERDNLGDNRPTAEVGAGVDFYMMAGMNIPGTLPEPPGRIKELFGMIDGGGGNKTETTQAEDDRDGNESTLTGTGIVVGAHAFASAEVNAVLYARLAILAGLDFMAFQYPDGTGCITESGEEIPEIGVNGWYGTGRAYVGLEGILGAKGRFMGNEIDVRIMHLVAAAMVEAGGPRPMYLNGRLGIYYSLLGGLIEGSARMKINVGQRCQPIGGSPFGFPIIVDSSPSQNGGEVSALVRPKVSFSIPVAANPNQPRHNEIVRIPDTEGNVHQRFAYVHSFTVTARGSGSRSDYSRDDNYPLLIQKGRAAEYRANGYISAPYGVFESRNWRMRVVVKAKEKLSNGQWVNVPGIGGRDYEEVREVDFTTGPLPEEMLDEQVGMTKPFRFQHFYLQEDSGHRRAVVHTRQNEAGDYFATSRGFINYAFDGVIVDEETGEEVTRSPVTYHENSRRALFALPTLENDREYQLMIVRRATNQLQGGDRLINRNQVIKRVGSREAYEADEINSQYQVTADVVDLAQAIALDPNETLIFRWKFRTSEHNTLADKLAGTSLRSFYNNGYQRVRIEGSFEGFDHYDIYGKDYAFGTNDVDEDRFVSEPLVLINDPFTSAFHVDQSRPLLGGFVNTYYAGYSARPTGIFARFSTELTMPAGGFSGNNGNLPGMEGSQAPINMPGPTTTIDGPGDVDLDWPAYPEYNNALNFDWSQSNISSQGGTLNEYIEPAYLQENTAAGLAREDNDPRIYFKYYITEKVLADAEELTDFYEYWRDRILRPEDHVADALRVDDYLNVTVPDRREENLEDLEEKYLDLVNSPLVRRPPATILTLADYAEEDDEEEEGTFGSGPGFLQTYTGNATYGNGSFGGGNGSGLVMLLNSPNAHLTAGGPNANMLNLSFAGPDSDSDINYIPAAETYRARNQWNNYSFSNQIRFRAFFPDTGGRPKTSRDLNLNN